MTVPRLPILDAKGWTARLKEAIPKRPDGTPITVWDQLPGFVQGLRGQRDILASHEIQLLHHKADLDAHAAALASLPAADAKLQKTLSECLAALEALKSRPF